jgi:SSS family solute:Na+ symporter
MTLQPLDWLAIVFYALVLLGIGFGIAPRWERGGGTDAEEFLLAGRRLSLPFFVATLVATWYGAILGVGEFVYRYGVVAWLCLGVPYYVAAVSFALWIAGRIREQQTLTLPEQLQRLYGAAAGRLGALVLLVITIPAAYMLMLAQMLATLLGWRLEMALLLGTVFSVVYLLIGGFRADVLTNALQFVLMYAGFVVLLLFATARLGGLEELWQRLPPQHRSVPGELGWMGVAVWFAIALQTFVDPSFYQRCAAARSPALARRGILVSVGLWCVFDALTLLAGLYARAYIQTVPLNAYPALAEAVLPAGWKGLFVVALLATVMSTLESYTFLAAATLGNDLLQAVPKVRAWSVRRRTQLGIVVTTVGSALLAYLIPSAVELFVRTASIAVPALLFAYLLGYSRRYALPAHRAVPLMGMTALASLLWMLLRHWVPQGLPELEPMVVGMGVGALLSLLWRRRHDAVALDTFERD